MVEGLTLSVKERAAFADRLVHAEATREWMPPLTETHPGVSIDDAYAIAREVHDRKIAAGQRVVGRKIGITSAPMRELAGADEPDFGNLYDGWHLKPGESLPRHLLNTPSVEIEIAFALAAPLEGGQVGPEEVARATEHVYPAIEVVDTRYARRGPGALVIDNVADAAWCGRFVLADSPRRLDEIEVADADGALLINGAVKESGSSAAVMGNPLHAVAWLANKLSEFGEGLAEGDIVLSGSFIRAVPIDAGDVVTGSFAGWDDVTFEVTP